MKLPLQFLTVALLFPGLLLADTPEAAPGEAASRQTAVTLNYCRAALHRIRTDPSKSVIIEEQQRILNNLDLNQIDDPEVITLYQSILDEIGTVEITDRERVVIDEQFRRGMHRKLGTDLFVIGAQAATAQVGSLIQTGANSWWDYRTRQTQRDADMWRVEKQNFTKAMTRSSSFLDSFWKLSRKNNIPDRWLVRDLELDQLGDALGEPDPEKRLRKLNRLERFMECYPPYWYYVARTQQQLGQVNDAVETYRKLAEIGTGHFRQDDMLAGCMANLAMLLEVEGDSESAAVAMKAYDYSIRNWEANLLCAWVLGRNSEFREAEDLILCNLDEGLETEQTTVALVSLYYHSDDRTRLAEVLADASVVRRIPVPGLLLCATKLGSEDLPRSAAVHLASTLSAVRRTGGRTPGISVSASHGWKLADANARILIGQQTLHSAGVRQHPEGTEVEFIAALDAAVPVAVDQLKPIRMSLEYPGTPPIEITFASPAVADPADRGLLTRLPGIASNLPGVPGSTERQRYQISQIEMEGVRISIRSDDDDPRSRSVLLPPVEESGSVIR